VETLKTRLASKNCEERRVTEVSRCVIARGDCACPSVTDPCWIGIQGVKCHGSMFSEETGRRLIFETISAMGNERGRMIKSKGIRGDCS
jgi:hypothetical protein